MVMNNSERLLMDKSLKRISQKKITKTMAYVVGRMAEVDGKLKRFPGGFWRTHAGAQEHFGTKTVQALVTRGLANYSEYKDGINGPFPIEVTMTAEYSNISAPLRTRMF